MKTYIKLAEAHIDARLNGTWDYPEGTTMSKEEIVGALKEGKTIHALLEAIETAKISISSIVMATRFKAVSGSYRAEVRKAFKQLVVNLNLS